MPADTVRKTSPYTAAIQQAAIASYATGNSLEQVAQDFGIHRNTIQRWCKDVRKVDNPSNPLSESFKPRLIQKAVRSIEQGLDARRDPYRAATIGVDVMRGLGIFTNASNVAVQGDVQLTVQWLTPETDARVINVTPHADPANIDENAKGDIPPASNNPQ